MLAEFARLDSAGLLTMVGGGFDRIEVGSLGLVHQVFLVLRFNLAAEETSAAFGVQVVSPGEPAFQLGISGTATMTDTGARTVSGNRDVVSVIGLGLPVSSAGRYSIQVSVNGELTRTVPLEVDLVAEAAG
jgi:hypothetical protein